MDPVNGKIYAVSGSSMAKILQENRIRKALGEITFVEMRDVAAMIVVDPSEVTLEVSGTKKLSVSFLPEGSVVSWASSDSTTVSVDGGTITALKAGNAVISASITVGGTTYKDVCNVTVLPPEHDITVAEAENGTAATSPSGKAREGDEVTVTATPASGYELGSITVMKGETEVSVENGKFTMPDGNVTVTATFSEVQQDEQQGG